MDRTFEASAANVQLPPIATVYAEIIEVAFGLS
jgi:hypothetical protein